MTDVGLLKSVNKKQYSFPSSKRNLLNLATHSVAYPFLLNKGGVYTRLIAFP